MLLRINLVRNHYIRLQTIKPLIMLTLLMPLTGCGRNTAAEGYAEEAEAVFADTENAMILWHMSSLMP